MDIDVFKWGFIALFMGTMFGFGAYASEYILIAMAIGAILGAVVAYWLFGDE